MAQGRQESAAVRVYLEALRSSKPKRGRKRTRDSVESRLGEVEAQLAAGVSPMDELGLVQERRDLRAELEAFGDDGGGLEAAQAEFVKVAASYSERRGISYASWRDVGVPAAVLREAGVPR